MSTNNNRLGKEIQPGWIAGQKDSKIAKVSGVKLQRLMTNSIEDITALSLKDRGIEKLEDFLGFSKLQRLDISENGIKRLSGMAALSQLGMFNISKNSLDGSSSCEDLRYLIELRTLNIGFNPKIKHLESHVMKPLVKLQALVANDCGFSRVSFLKYCQGINTLVLSKNSLTRFPTCENLMFERLTKLSLGHNSLEAIPDLTVCPHLLELRVNNNLITAISEMILVPSKLKVLELSSNRLTSWENIDILRRLKHLTNLSLKGRR
jgi:Leucine-rich repeat (LRR) protein